MRFKDAYRAQYFIHHLEKEFEDLSNLISSQVIIPHPLKEVLNDFFDCLNDELDQIILPTICFEIHKVKNQFGLAGETPTERYASFFIKNGNFSEEAIAITKNYDFLFEMVDHIIQCSFNNLKECLLRFNSDKIAIEQEFNESLPIQINKISIISESDRHRNRQALLISFSNNLKIIYKPTDLFPDVLFSEFVKKLNIPEPYDLKCMRVLPRNNYGWLEYINHKPCSNLQEVRNYYRKAGVLLAVADSVNYTDGHSENLIAFERYPVLLDGETFFQNYAPEVLQHKNILSTSLIQKKIDLDCAEISYNNYCSAFQALSIHTKEILHTYSENDHTDEMRVHFRGISKSKNQNSPFINDEYFTASEFIAEVSEGFSFAYDLISKNIDVLINNKPWWEKMENIRPRIVIRETAAYLYLIRQIQQPVNCISKTCIENFIKGKLSDSPYIEYELSDILKFNIPYFYHYPKKCHLYDGNDNCYPDVFSKCALDIIKEQFLDRNEQKKQFNQDIIQRHLSERIF